MQSLLIIAVLAAPRPTLVIDTSVDAGRCAATMGLRNAVARRLPGLTVRAKGRVKGDDLRVTFAGGPETWNLTVRRADDSIALVRAIAIGPGGCEALADAGALIIDRFLADLRWPGLPAPIAPQEVEEEQPIEIIEAAPPAPPAPPPPVELKEEPPPKRPTPHEVAILENVAVGLAVVMRVPSSGDVQVGGRFTFELALGIAARTQLSVSQHAPLETAVVFNDRNFGAQQLGRLTSLEGLSTLTAGYCWRATLTLCADAGGGVSWTVVSPSKDEAIVNAADATVARAVFGGDFELGWSLGFWGLDVRANAGAWGRLDPSRFFVEGVVDSFGAPAPVFESPSFELVVGLAIVKGFL